MEENETTEFKRTLDEEGIIRTAVAFANGKGGRIFVGLSDDGSAVGLAVGKQKLEQFTSRIHGEVQPAIAFGTAYEAIDGKQVLVVDVQESRRKPVFCRGAAYKRVNKTTLRVTDPEELRSLFVSKTVFFDDMVCEGASILDIDPKGVERFAEMAQSSGRLSRSSHSADEILGKLGLLEGRRLKNGAIMLFGRNPQKFFKTWGIRCAAVSGDFDFLAMEDCEGNVLSGVEKAMDFIVRNAKKEISMSGMRRVEKPVIPLEALREGLVNAVAHRDYFFPSYTYVTIHPGFIEIKNPGKLEGISVEELSRPHPSVIKNPHIAQALYLSGYIEKWGSGTLRMIRAMRENLLQDPKFIPNSMFSVRLEYGRQEFNEREKFILESLKKSIRIKPKGVAAKYGRSITSSVKDFAHLARLGLIVKRGRGRASLYEIAKLH